MGDAEKVADGRAHVDELEFAIRFAGGDIETDEHAEAGAVHAGEIGEVENDALFAREQFLYMRFEQGRAFGDERTAAMQGEDVLLLMSAERQLERGDVRGIR